jgi:hypothetical protein
VGTRIRVDRGEHESRSIGLNALKGANVDWRRGDATVTAYDTAAQGSLDEVGRGGSAQVGGPRWEPRFLRRCGRPRLRSRTFGVFAPYLHQAFGWGVGAIRSRLCADGDLGSTSGLRTNIECGARRRKQHSGKIDPSTDLASMMCCYQALRDSQAVRSPLRAGPHQGRRPAGGGRRRVVFRNGRAGFSLTYGRRENLRRRRPRQTQSTMPPPSSIVAITLLTDSTTSARRYPRCIRRPS